MELKCDSKWIDLKVEINKRDLLDVFFRNQTHKTVNRHGTQEWRCNLHLEDVDSSAHLMSVEYRRCASVSCHENVAKNVECPFTYLVVYLVVYLISLSIFSHETEEDFIHFYMKLLELCAMLNILFVPSFIMQDGALSSYNAAEVVLIKSGISPLLMILMCWFHVKFKVKKRLTGNSKLDIVMSDK